MVDNMFCNIAQSAHANQLLRFVFSRTSFLQSKTISLFNSATLQKYSGTSRGLPVFDDIFNSLNEVVYADNRKIDTKKKKIRYNIF